MERIGSAYQHNCCLLKSKKRLTAPHRGLSQDLRTQPPESPFVKGEVKGVVESGLSQFSKSGIQKMEGGEKTWQ